MKKVDLAVIFLTLLFCSSKIYGQSLLCKSTGLSCPVELNELVKRGELYYKKFSDKPFSGKVGGQQQGMIKHGKKSGSWKQFYKNGQLHISSTYKKGKLDGMYEEYGVYGKEGPKGMYENGVREGKWVNESCYKVVGEFKLDCDWRKTTSARYRAILGITNWDIDDLNCDDPQKDTVPKFFPIKDYFTCSKIYEKGNVVNTISQ
ncbi:hypothetical protein OA343_02915 [Paracoccaceae bacterium]|nr:hypothetical protein [Paracoccaceae bacterium]